LLETFAFWLEGWQGQTKVSFSFDFDLSGLRLLSQFLGKFLRTNHLGGGSVSTNDAFSESPKLLESHELVMFK